MTYSVQFNTLDFKNAQASFYLFNLSSVILLCTVIMYCSSPLNKQAALKYEIVICLLLSQGLIVPHRPQCELEAIMFKLFNDKQILNESEETSVAQKSGFSLCPYGSVILPLFPPKVFPKTPG